MKATHSPFPLAYGDQSGHWIKITSP